MEIFVRCTLDENQLSKAKDIYNYSDDELIEMMEKCLNEDVFETLDDNRELFSEIKFSIKQPLYEN